MDINVYIQMLERDMNNYCTWKKTVKHCEKKIYDLEEDICRLQSIKYDAIPSITDSQKINDRLYQYMDEKKRYEDILYKLYCNIDYVDMLCNLDTLNNLQKNIVFQVFCTNQSFCDVAANIGYSESYLRVYVDKILLNTTFPNS